MGLFQAIDSATSGAGVARQWLDAIADNVANANTVSRPGEEPFRARLVVARAKEAGRELPGRGVEVAGMALKGGEAAVVHDPSHPYADENGNVTRAVVDLSEEFTNMVLAARTYQANLSVLDRVRDAYLKALEIGTR